MTPISRKRFARRSGKRSGSLRASAFAAMLPQRPDADQHPATLQHNEPELKGFERDVSEDTRTDGIQDVIGSARRTHEAHLVSRVGDEDKQCADERRDLCPKRRHLYLLSHPCEAANHRRGTSTPPRANPARVGGPGTFRAGTTTSTDCCFPATRSSSAALRSSGSFAPAIWMTTEFSHSLCQQPCAGRMVKPSKCLPRISSMAARS